jgi:uncharacterized protein (TIGR03084 family)
MNVSEVLADLIAEQNALDAIVSELPPADWSLPTPSPGWSIADQIGHLTYFDGTAALAINDPDAFMATVTALLAGMAGGAAGGSDPTLEDARAMEPAELLEAWRVNRTVLDNAASGLAEDARVVWYGPSMGAKSFLTARLMEVWAHGQDVVDAIGADREATDRLQHIAQLGFITRGWSYKNRGLTAPEVSVRVELTAPSGDIWSYGPADADESVAGPAEDFCLVVTQRRHVDATALVTDGDAARDWMLKAQAFAGAATDGPAPT